MNGLECKIIYVILSEFKEFYNKYLGTEKNKENIKNFLPEFIKCKQLVTV